MTLKTLLKHAFEVRELISGIVAEAIEGRETLDAVIQLAGRRVNAEQRRIFAICMKDYTQISIYLEPKGSKVVIRPEGIPPLCRGELSPLDDPKRYTFTVPADVFEGPIVLQVRRLRAYWQEELKRREEETMRADRQRLREITARFEAHGIKVTVTEPTKP